MKPNAPQKPRPYVPGVVVCREKHGNRSYAAPEEATLHKVALMILGGRLKEGYWYYKPAPKDKPKAPDYTDPTEINSLRGEIKAKAVSALRSYQAALAAHNQEIEAFDEIQRAVKDQDGKLAWKILRFRSDGEYEGVALEFYATSY